MVSRREFIGISAGVIGGLVVGGVGGSLLARPSAVSTTTTTEGGTGTVTKILTQSQTASAVSNLAALGTIVVGVDISGADNLDPAITEDADACWIPLHNAYQKPLQWQYPNFSSLVGDLFTNVSLASDNVTYTLTGFNSKARFATGDPVTAADVVYTMQRGLEVGATGLTGAYTALNNLSNPAKISSPDSDSLVFVIDSPTAPSLVEDLLAEIAYGVVNQKQLTPNQKSVSATGTETATTDQGSAWLNAGNSAGSGPFVITSWEKDTQIAMEANQYYAGNNPLNPNPVKLKKVIFHHVADAATELALLKSGEIDLMWNPTPPQVASQQFVEGYNVETHLQCAIYAIFLNTVNAPLNNKLVWQAMKYAIDYTSLWNSVLPGLSSPLQTMSFQGALGYDSSMPFSLNPTMAKSLLSQAGYPNGVNITLGLPASDPLIQLAAPAIQSNMAQCGITVTLQNTDESTLVGQWSKGDFEAVFWGEGGGLNHIADTAWECLDYRAQVFATWAGYNDPKIEALIDACKVPTLTDPEFATASLAVTQYALQNSPVIVTWQWVTSAILSTSVQSLPVPYGRLHVDYGRAYKQGVSGFS